MQSDMHMSVQSQLQSHMNRVLNRQMGSIGSKMQQHPLQQPKPNATQSSMTPSHLQQNTSMAINPRGQMDMTISSLRSSLITNGQPVTSTRYNHDIRPLPPPIPSARLPSPRQSMGINNLFLMVSQPIQSLPHCVLPNMPPKPQHSIHQMQNRHGSLPPPQLQSLGHGASPSPQNSLSIPHMDSQQQGQHEATLSTIEPKRKIIHQSRQDNGRLGHDQNQTNLSNQVDQQGSPGQQFLLMMDIYLRYLLL